MTKIFTLITLLLPFTLFAQIQIVSTDMVSVGDTIQRAVVTQMTGVTPGPKGANQIWDYSNVVPALTETNVVKAPSNTPYASSYTTSNLAITQNNVDYAYFKNSSTALEVTGGAGDFLGNGNLIRAVFSPTADLYRFPTSYGNIFTDNYYFEIKGKGSTFDQSTVDSVRFRHRGTVRDTVEAWGKVITPLGSYDALKVKRVDYTVDSVWIKAFSIPFLPPSPWTLADVLKDTLVSITFLSKETKMALAEFEFDSIGNPTKFRYTLVPPTPTAEFSWIDNVDGSVSFTNLSENAQANSLSTSFWDFGDGITSTTSGSPNHTYLIDSTYYVCLTVTNSTATSTFCDSVTVTGGIGVNSAPVATNDFIQVWEGDSANVDILANDNDPNNHNITYTIYGGPTQGTLADDGNGNITYYSTQGFLGFDTIFYSICDDHPDVLCDSALLIVEVLEVIQAPVAGFTYSVDPLDNCLTFTGFSTTTNDPTSVTWNLGDGTQLSGDTVTHTFSSKGSYYVCLSAVNLGGTDTWCDSVSLACVGIAPTADRIAVRVYPNPTHSELNFSAESDKPLFVQLYNILGEEIVSESWSAGSENLKIDVSQLPSGMYFYRISKENFRVAAGPIVIEK